MYSSSPDAVADVPEIVCKYAGRIDGGDFKWTFDNATDDEDHSVNTPLKKAITEYEPQLIGYQESETSSINAVHNDNDTKVFDLLGNERHSMQRGVNIVKSGKRSYKVAK